jgi:hypothetical protein
MQSWAMMKNSARLKPSTVKEIKMSDSNKILFWVVFLVALIILGPVAVIWSLNTLFPALAIPLSLDTWCAVVVLSSVFKTTITRK